MARLFGTDGVRGIANIELTCELSMRIGIAAASVLTKNKNKVRVIIGNDGRESADMLVSGLVAGLCSVGVDVINLGVIPTPAISYLVKYYEVDAGIMVTASHNPYQYNGIKIFDSNGFKLPDELEDEIEEFIFKDRDQKTKKMGKIILMGDPINDYIEHLISTVNGKINNLHIAVDCANGASSVVAEKLFKKLGIKCDILNNKPNGININDDCGSLYAEKLGQYVKANNLDGGVAFDGDADRAIFVDELGNVIDGDFVLAILGLEYKNNGCLNKNAIVGTVMSNLGFIKFCHDNDISFSATKVGDRYVLEEINNNDLSLGGEQSGHIIIKKFSNTGDGELTAIQVFNCLFKSGKKFSELSSVMKKYPQVLENVEIENCKKNDFYTNKKVQDCIVRVSKLLEGTGRVLVRPSGTEPLIRVMIEGEDIDYIRDLAKKLALEIKEILG